MNIGGPVEIGSGVYWVGGSLSEFLRRNSYLRVFRGKGKTINVLIDPGAPADWEPLSRKVGDVIGNIEHVHVITVNHQDPDVGANAATLAQLNPNVLLLMTEDTWRLAQYYGLSSRNFRAVERFKKLKVMLPTGHVLQFVPTPFCHFRGACMVYDPEARILFSGDLFGGIAAPRFMAEEASWIGIKAFHQLYMPSKEALRLAVKRIRELDPPPRMIAPQHGGILSGEVMRLFINKMENLEVGLDIITGLSDKIPVIIDALNATLEAVRDVIGSDAVRRAMQIFQPDGSYPAIFSITNEDQVTDIKAEPLAAVGALVRVLFRLCPDDQKNAMRSRIWGIFLDRNLPPPESALSGDEESIETEILESE